MRNYFLINLILLTITAFLAWELYEVLARPFTLTSATAGISRGSADGAKGEGSVGQVAVKDPSVYLAIVQKDLFRPARTEPKKEELAKMQPQTPPPKLVGTLVTEVRVEAYLEDAVTKSVKGYRVKDTIGDFTVLDIKDNQVVLKRGNEKVTVGMSVAGQNPLGIEDLGAKSVQGAVPAVGPVQPHRQMPSRPPGSPRRRPVPLLPQQVPPSSDVAR